MSRTLMLLSPMFNSHVDKGKKKKKSSARWAEGEECFLGMLQLFLRNRGTVFNQGRRGFRKCAV